MKRYRNTKWAFFYVTNHQKICFNNDAILFSVLAVILKWTYCKTMEL